MSGQLSDEIVRLQEMVLKRNAAIEQLKAENRRLLEEIEEAEARASVLQQKEAAREKRFRMERFN